MRAGSNQCAACAAVISPALLARLLPRMRRGGSTTRTDLTEREREVLALMSDGLSNQAIADRLVVSVHTVRNHVANLSAKLGAHSKLEALSIAIRRSFCSEVDRASRWLGFSYMQDGKMVRSGISKSNS